MAAPVMIASEAQFTSLLSSSTIVVANFFAEWCPPCKMIAPVYVTLSKTLSRPKHITFCKINVDEQKGLSQRYQITAMPTFMIFKSGQVVSTMQSSDPKKLSEALQQLAAEAAVTPSASTSATATEGGFVIPASTATASGPVWYGASIEKGYSDVSDQIETKGVELMNSDAAFGGVKALFASGKPTGEVRGTTTKGKGKGDQEADQGEKPDWVESDADEQLLLFLPFRATLKVQGLQITSIVAKKRGGSEDDQDQEEEEEEEVMRPKTIRLFINHPRILSFEEAEDTPATQEIVLGEKDWDPKTGTAKLDIRFVKFQAVSSLVFFVMDGAGDGERCRIDRIRVIGESGEKKEMGKLEKFGDEPGE